MSPLRHNLLRLLTLLGAALSAWLAWRHVQFVIGHDVRGGVCAVFGPFNCAAIEGSAFSEVLGVPTASLGLLYYGFFFAVLAGTPAARRGKSGAGDPLPLVHALSLTGLIVTAALASISAFVIGSLCLGCVMIYGINLAIAGILLGDGPAAYLRGALRPVAAVRAWFELKSARLWLAAWAIVIMPAALAAPPMLVHRAWAEPAIEPWLNGERHVFATTSTSLFRGPDDAPLEVVVFTDFECRYCRTFHGVLERLLDELPAESYRLIYKHYPLSEQCNPAFRGAPLSAQHPRACRFAELAQAIAQFDVFWDVASDLYGFQSRRDLSGVFQVVAARAGIDPAEWAGRLRDPAIQAAVAGDIREGNQAGLIETPGVYIQGRYVANIREDNVRRILRIALWGRPD